MADYTRAEPLETDIAIVGMAGKFPGAPNVDALWRRVLAGDDCLVDFGVDDLRAAGVSERLLGSPNYVRRNGVLDDVEMFDAGFFGVGPRDAALMDPQHRHFIECVWEALESSGHVPERFGGAIGLFAGCGMNTYMLNNLLTNPQLVERVGMFLLRHTANDKDFLTTTVSYRLDLRGPSVNVQTACSTSLVAVHLAIQSLLAMECDLAVAGGATIEVPHRQGYLYEEGEILAPDGVCRAFDAQSGGTVLTSGAGAVALRRLQDALDEGDPILAVLKASAVNNDGQRKVSYLAPSVDGHADVIKEALAVAGLSARDLQLFEAHGTGTAVGDPIEFAAASEAFRGSTDDTGFCRLTSTKPNIGHLDTAAGVASLIKVVQALRHRTLPPMANYTGASPLIPLERSPFVLSGSASPWPGDRPRRAGVSSLGVGGTNAHVIVEEPPEPPPTPAAVGEQLLVLSARDKSSLDAAAAHLAEFLEHEPDLNVADVAYTLATGRRHHGLRRVLVADNVATAADALRRNDRNRVSTTEAVGAAPRVVFMFPGGGSQYRGMADGLDERFSVFHEVMNDGIERVKAQSGLDLAPLLRLDAAPDALAHPTTSLPAVFLTSVALARQWMAWGVAPDALVGHSLGEYTAAHLSGVLTFDGAIQLIVARAELMERASGVGAAMLAVPLSADEVRAILPATLSLATMNAPDECVVSGRLADVEAFKVLVDDDDRQATLIPLAAAAHSALLDPVLEEFHAVVRNVELSPPVIPYLSNLHGGWITAQQATSSQYWVDHLRQTVRFDENLATVLADGPTVLFELGPGHSLSSYARRQPTKPVAAIPALRHPNQDVDDTVAALGAFARGWAAGLDVDLTQFAGVSRRHVRLPGYQFARERHWTEPGAGRPIESSPAVSAPVTPTIERVASVDESFWQPTWIAAERRNGALRPIGPWLVVGDPRDELVAALATALRSEFAGAVDVVLAPTDEQLGTARSIVLAGRTASFAEAADRWLHVAAAAARALGAVDDGSPILLAAVTVGATDAGGPATAPMDALALGVVGVAGREYPNVVAMLVDTDPTTDATTTAATVLAELTNGADRLIALRGRSRLVPQLVRHAVSERSAPSFRRGGSYVVTGGLGGVGFVFARHLLVEYHANVVVVASRDVPSGAERAAWLVEHGFDDATSRRIRQLSELEALGGKVTVVTADLADASSVAAMLDAAEQLIGHVDGVVHAAGDLRDKPLELATNEDLDAVVGAKAAGALALVDELERRGGEMALLVSSTSTTLMAEGQAAYVAANSVLDSLAGSRSELRVVTVNFGLWSDTGVAARTAHRTLLGIEPGERVDHPIFTEMHRHRNGDVSLTGIIDAHHHWVVDEHRSSAGAAVLPGAAHLELYLAAVAAVHGDANGLELTDVGLYEPLVVADNEAVTVRVVVSPDGSLRLESHDASGDWRLHGDAAFSGGAVPVTVFVPPSGLDAIAVDPLARPDSQLALGGRWHQPTDAWRDGNVVYGTITLDDAVQRERNAWFAHPAVVDVATAFGVTLGDRTDALYVPIGYERVARWRPVPPVATVVARLAEGSSDDLLKVDLDIADEHDEVVVRIEGLALRPIDHAGDLGVAAAGPTAGVAAAGTVRLPPLLALALTHGITAPEGMAMIEELLGSGRPRLMASTIAPDDLVELNDHVSPPPQPTPNAAGTVGGSVHAAVRQIWVDLLGVDDLGDDDDFFDTGGHSLIAIRVMSRISKDLGVRFQLATIFEAPTIRSLAELVRAARPELDAELAAAGGDTQALSSVSPSGPTATTAAPGAAASLVTISPAGDRQPLFIVHGAGGNVLFLWSLARALAGTRPIYGFQACGVDGENMPDASIEDMAARYVSELRAKFQGPYLLGGYSGGGIVTFEMVRQLRELGEDVRLMVLFDSVPPGKAEPPPREAMGHLLSNVRRHGVAKVSPFIKRSLKTWAGKFLPRDRFREVEHEGVKHELGLGDLTDLGFVNLYYYFSAAAERYQMTSIDADALVLKAEWVWPIQPHDYHWGGHIRGTIDVAEVPGDHNAMFFPENAPRLGDVLRKALDERGL